MNTKNKQRVMYPKDDLMVEINEVIEQKVFQSQLWRDINIEFESKGLDVKSLQLLLDDDKKTASDLTDYELIAFAKIAYRKLKKDKFNPLNYFGETTLINYENNILNTKVEKVDKLILKDFRKIDEFNYRGQISYKDLYDYFNNNLIIYDHNAQRSPKYREVGSKNGKSRKLKIVNLNMDTVEDISKSILSEVFEDSEIILNCEMLENKEQKFRFDAKYKDIFGDILIETNYDMQSDKTTWVTIPDGYHRCRGIILAMNKYYAKEGVWLEGSIGVKLVRATKERARRIVYQTFLRSPDEPEWTKTLAEDDYTKFVDMVVKNSKTLTIENTIEEVEANDKLTSKSLLVDIIKTTDIKVNELSKAFFDSKSIAKNFDIAYDFVKNKNAKVNPYTIAGYIYISYLVGDNINQLLEVLDKITNDEKFNSMARKNLNVENFVDFINRFVDEVISNE